MAAILANDILKGIFLNANDANYTKVCSIDNKSALVHVVTWRLIGDKPFPEPAMNLVTDAYTRH